MKRGVGAASLAVLVACAGTAGAQPTSDAAAAETMFNEAQKLANTGNYAEACPKYAESLRLDTGIGASLYLADCYERIGKTASAWAQFREAEELALKQSDKRATTAHQRAAALESKLARLVIRLSPGADVPGLELKRDGIQVGRPQWRVPVPVDPGAHVIVASAPGKKTRQVSVLVTAREAPTSLEITPLDGQPASSDQAIVARPKELPVAAPLDQPKGSTNSQRTVAYAVGAAGLVGLFIGAYFGFDTISKNNSATHGHCQPSGSNDACDGIGLHLLTQAQTSATASNVAFGVGAAVLAGGVILLVTSPSSKVPAVGLQSTPDGRGGGFVLHARW